MARPPDAPPESLLLQQFSGLRNTVSRERLAPGELEIARNIDLDDAGQIHRRRGFTLRDGGNWRDLFAARSGKIYGIRNNELGRVNPDFSFDLIQQNMGDDRVTYVEAGKSIYFSSIDVSGKILADDTSTTWGAFVSEGQWVSPIVNPNANLQPIKGRLLGKPPLATALTHFNGRIYLAEGNLLWATELFLYDLVDKTRNFVQFESEIRCLGFVSDGIYVGTATGVYFMSGAFTEMKRIRVSEYPAMSGSVVQLEADGLPDKKTVSREAILMMTENGLCVGYDSGIFSSLTGDKIWLPSAKNVAAMVRRQDGVQQYVGVMDNGGTPASSARIGDYVDAEIRRFVPPA